MPWSAVANPSIGIANLTRGSIMTKGKGSTTAERIIEASLELFNKEGERFISTNHIATYLNMSPGNLYYHFRNKYEIITRLFRRYRKELLDLIEGTNTPKSGEDLYKLITKIFDVMWKYRFFFDVSGLLQKNQTLLQEHNEFVNSHVSQHITSFLKRMSQEGLLEIDPDDVEAMALNMWLIIKYWFVFDKSLHQNELQRTSKKRGVVQVITLIYPYLCDDYKRQIDELKN